MQYKPSIGMDWISNLPDPVLSHILSFLPTKLAASTCILSKRWQFLWTMVHNFDLDCDNTNFANILTRLFSQRDKDLCMKSLRLKSCSPCTKTHVDSSWLLVAISCGIEQLDLDFNVYVPFELHPSLFTCKTLVVLKLKFIAIDAMLSIHLPSLKVLHLVWVKYRHHDSLGNLLSCCPVLDSLVLEEVSEVEELHGCFIFSSSLRDLIIVQKFGEPISFWVDAPSLECLGLDLSKYRGIYLKNLDNLVQAVVDLHPATEKFGEPISFWVDVTLGDLYNVQVLKLKRYTMQVIRNAPIKDFPVFHNLIRLELDGVCCFWCMLLSLLQKVPYLQHLTIHVGCFECEWCRIFLIGYKELSEQQVPKCYSHLRTFCLNGAFNNGDGFFCADLEFATFAVKNCTVLEKMTISCCSDLSWLKRYAFQHKLASLERASKKCELKFEGEVL